jgi:hypothetical protein
MAPEPPVPSPASGETANSGATSLQRENAKRALTAYDAMQAHFYVNDGTSLYYEAPRGEGAKAYAALWPFTRALAATLDLEGVERALLPGFNSYRAMVDRLAGLGHYWDAHGNPAAYDSDVTPPHGHGGDKYYDDNAWVGLALVQHDRLRSVASSRKRAAELFAFALTGWDSNPRHPSPGGLFWVKQGAGRGLTDHTRHTISNAPNAELGFHLHELTGSSAFDGDAQHTGARNMYDWVNEALDESRATAQPATGLYFDNMQLDGNIDKTVWTYNQGVMIGANVLQHRLTGEAQYLPRAEAIAHKTMTHFAGKYSAQPEQFNAILFRNLLLLHHATADTALRQSIIDVVSAYADQAWRTRRDSNNLFPKGGPRLLKHAAMVQVFALLAWAPAQYHKLA